VAVPRVASLPMPHLLAPETFIEIKQTKDLMRKVCEEAEAQLKFDTGKTRRNR